MNLKLKSLTGKDKIIDIDAASTINELKTRIETFEMISPPQQRLICNGKVLIQGDKTLSEYKINANSTIHFVLALRGGGTI